MTANHQYLDDAHVSAAAAAPADPKFTGSDIEGPFYRPDTPQRTRTHPAPTLTLTGTVRDGADNPIPDAKVEFWQCDESGDYDEHGPDLRGTQYTAADGSYRLETVHPGRYVIGDTEERCSHLHAKVTPPGGPTLTTQLYFPGDAANAADRWYDPAREAVRWETRGGGNHWRFDFVVRTSAAAAC